MLGLNETQVGHARDIMRVVIAYGFTEDVTKRFCDIALMTAITESSLYIWASRKIAESLNYPYDKGRIGDDFDSVGLFQQRPSWAGSAGFGWGNVQQCMDTEHATRRFIDELRKKNWRDMTNWAAAQAVQYSAFADGSNYRANDRLAIQLRTALWDEVVGKEPATKPNPSPAKPKPNPSKPAATGTYKVKPGDTLTSISQRTGISIDQLAKTNGIRDRDFIRVGQVLTLDKPTPRPKTYKVREGDTLSGIADRYGTTWQALALINGLSDADLIHPGQKQKLA